MLLKDDHEEKRRKSIKRERRKVREKGGKEAPMQMENIKMYEKTEKSEKTGKQKKFEREDLLRIKHCLQFFKCNNEIHITSHSTSGSFQLLCCTRSDKYNLCIRMFLFDCSCCCNHRSQFL